MNGNAVTTDDAAPALHHTTKCRCNVVPYEQPLQAEMECKLYQDGKPCSHLNSDKDAEFRVKVCLIGDLRYHLCGVLCVCLHIECIGPGPEITLPCKKQKLDPCDDDHCYEFVIPIPAGTLGPGEEECGQVCCFTATLTSFTLCDQPGHIACWCKGPCVMIYQEPEHG